MQTKCLAATLAVTLLIASSAPTRAQETGVSSAEASKQKIEAVADCACDSQRGVYSLYSGKLCLWFRVATHVTGDTTYYTYIGMLCPSLIVAYETTNDSYGAYPLQDCAAPDDCIDIAGHAAAKSLEVTETGAKGPRTPYLIEREITEKGLSKLATADPTFELPEEQLGEFTVSFPWKGRLKAARVWLVIVDPHKRKPEFAHRAAIVAFGREVERPQDVDVVLHETDVSAIGEHAANLDIDGLQCPVVLVGPSKTD